MTEFRRVFDFYAAKIKARESMVMYRFGDGELALVDGREVDENTQAFRTDHWRAPAKHTRLGRDLAVSLVQGGPVAHYGIPCPCCNEPGYRRLRDLQSPTFPANLFINANYGAFREWLPTLKSAAVISNARGDQGRLPIRVLAEMFVRNDCVNDYEIGRNEILREARVLARDLEGEVVLVAAGPLSEAIIYFMWNENPNNTYVDVGSAMDEWLYGQKTRPYMVEGSEYATRACALPPRFTQELPAHAPAETDGGRNPSEKQADLLVSRFIRKTDIRVERVAGLTLPKMWWSRPYEYAWAQAVHLLGSTDPDALLTTRYGATLDAACGLSHPFKFWLTDYNVSGENTHACDIDPRILSGNAILTDVVNDFPDDDVLIDRALDAIDFKKCSITLLPYPDSKFERIYCISVLEHMLSCDMFAALVEFKRTLSPTGLLAITFDVSPNDIATSAGKPLTTAVMAFAERAGLIPAGLADLDLPADALHTAMYGGLYCFRAVFKRPVQPGEKT